MITYIVNAGVEVQDETGRMVSHGVAEIELVCEDRESAVVKIGIQAGSKIVLDTMDLMLGMTTLKRLSRYSQGIVAPEIMDGEKAVMVRAPLPVGICLSFCILNEDAEAFIAELGAEAEGLADDLTPEMFVR